MTPVKQDNAVFRIHALRDVQRSATNKIQCDVGKLIANSKFISHVIRPLFDVDV